ncbi:hypothetical protein [Joostella sp. CR20]|uniref:hypothetical protein n=1 Tax=Joostella sp. CR20 TaxID=2804312 RepID=UPI00313BFA61
MAKDIKELLQASKDDSAFQLPKGHRDRFATLLDEKLPQKKQKNTYLLWKVAAVIAVVFGVGISVYFNTNTEVETNAVVATPTQNSSEETAKITLGDISPDLKKVEDFYVANINLELADIDLTEANKKLLDGYMNRLSELNDAYKELTLELNEVGPNNQTINALINNLQLRLQLLYRLKEKINELKETEHEKFEKQAI